MKFSSSLFCLLVVFGLIGARPALSAAQTQTTVQTAVLNADLMTIGYGSVPGTMLVGGTDGRMLRSTDNGESWQTTQLSGKLHILQIVARPHHAILAVSQVGLIKSLDDGKHWSSLTNQGFLISRLVYHQRSHRWIGVTMQGDILTSEDDGTHWTRRYGNPDHAPLTALSLAPDGYVIASGSGGHAISSIDATHWNPVKTGTTSSITRLLPLPGQQGILGFWSDTSITLFHPNGSNPSQLAHASNEVPYVATYDPIHRRTFMATTKGHLYRSDYPQHQWQDLGSIDNILITTLLTDARDGALTAVGARGLIARSTDGGLHWQRLSENIWGASLNTAFSPDGEHIVAAGTGGLLMQSADRGIHWKQSSANLKYYIHEILSTPDNQAVLAVGAQGFIARSIDHGQTWSRIHSGMRPDVTLFSILEHPQSHELLACGPMGSLLRSADNGLTWAILRPLREAGDGYLRQLVVASSGTLLAIGSPGYIVRSEDAGKTWQTTDADTHGGIRDAATAGHEVFVALRKNGLLLRSTDDGQHWQSTQIRDIQKGSLYTEPRTGIIWIMSRDSIYRSLDRGNSWLRIEIPGKHLNSMLRTQTGTLLGFGDEGIILRSNDNGLHWQNQESKIHSALRKPLEDVQHRIVYVPGRDGTLLMSRDDGIHWQSIETNTPAHLNRVWLSRDGKTLIATGERIVRITLP